MIITGKPYEIIEECKVYQIREFKDFNSEDFVWHRDKESRNITLLDCDCGSIQIQLDNQLPLILETGDSFYIPKETFHKVIPDESIYFKIRIEFI